MAHKSLRKKPLKRTATDALTDQIDAVLLELRDALISACSKHGPMKSPHEGHSVIREEFDELWDHVKADTGQTAEARKEALQLAAMGVRYVIDLKPGVWITRKP